MKKCIENIDFKVKQRMYFEYVNGHRTFEQIAKRYFITEREVLQCVGEVKAFIRNNHDAVKKHKSRKELCKTCRWRPCDGAPCCYRIKFDLGKYYE